METLIIALYLVALTILGIYGAHRGHLLMLYLRHRRNAPTPLRKFDEDELPTVTIQLPMFNEMYVVDRLMDGVIAIDYPKDKVQIQGYISSCYGSLKTFNFLFRDRDDWFGEGEG